jgi:hypothetical protein
MPSPAQRDGAEGTHRDEAKGIKEVKNENYL